MIRLKEDVDEKILEKYGFRKVSDSCSKKIYIYSFFKEDLGNFQSVDVYITPFFNVWGKIVYHRREVVARQHAFE